MHRLIAQYQETLLSFFTRRVRNVWDAEELTQEVYCKILKRKDISVSEYSEPYMMTIAWSVLRDRSRRDKVRHRHMHVAYDEALAHEDPLSPEKALHGEELYTRFLKVLNELSPRRREVFILSRYEGLSYPQIAEHCGISISAVEKHMIRALGQMREIVRNKDAR